VEHLILRSRGVVTIRSPRLATATRPETLFIRPPGTPRISRHACASKVFSKIHFSCRRATGPVGLLESQQARWPFSSAQLKCGRSLSFDRQVGACSRRRTSSSQFSHPGGTNPNRCCCATRTTATPGIKIYHNKGRRPRAFDCTDDTTSIFRCRKLNLAETRVRSK
jgi:hypothetical protein